MTVNNTKITRESKVSLKEITAETVRTICSLKVSESQDKFVAPNAISIAQAYFEPMAWFRAIYADDTPVGFIMLEKYTDKPEYFLWRMMITEEYQRMGSGDCLFILKYPDYPVCINTLPRSGLFILSYC